MSINTEKYKSLLTELKDRATLVAVSKTKPIEDIQALYDLGQRDFGENYVQEMADKEAALPKDIRWHFIGHLQSNKVKYMASFVHLIHGVDSWPLLKEINKQGMKNNRVINCLLQVHIAKEETKFGFNEAELSQLNDTAIIRLNELKKVQVTGLMGMASFSDDKDLIRAEFTYLKSLFDEYPQFTVLSMGMSADYTIALQEGSNMVRVGSLLFGERNYSK
jgi:pyridoxal phosphate enzyme (YggS family)